MTSESDWIPCQELIGAKRFFWLNNLTGEITYEQPDTLIEDTEESPGPVCFLPNILLLFGFFFCVSMCVCVICACNVIWANQTKKKQKK